MVEGADLDLLDLVSNRHEAGKEPGISEDLSTIDTTGSSSKSYWKEMEHSYVSFFSYAGKTGKNPNMKESLMQVIKWFSQFSWATRFVTRFLYDLAELDSFARAKMYKRSRWENTYKYHFVLEVRACIELRCIILQCWAGPAILIPVQYLVWLNLGKLCCFDVLGCFMLQEYMSFPVILCSRENQVSSICRGKSEVREAEVTCLGVACWTCSGEVQVGALTTGWSSDMLCCTCLNILLLVFAVHIQKQVSKVLARLSRLRAPLSFGHSVKWLGFKW